MTADHRALQPFSRDVHVRDIMQAVPPIAEGTFVADATIALASNPTGIVAVLEHGSERVLGVITGTDLIEKAALPLRPEIVRYLRAHGHPWADFDGAPTARTAREAMTHPFGFIGPDQPAWEAAEQMVASALKALPVLDERGQYLGMVSRPDILRSVSDIPAAPSAPRMHAARIARDGRVTEVVRTDIPTVRPDDRIPAVLDAVLSSPVHRTLVTDTDRRALGIIGDADLLQRITPDAPDGLLRRLRAAYLTDREIQAISRRTAGEIMHPEVVTIGPDASLAEALTCMLDLHMRLLPVVGAQQRLVGYVARDQLLADLIVPENERDNAAGSV